jgi:hypothetical protein
MIIILDTILHLTILKVKNAFVIIMTYVSWLQTTVFEIANNFADSTYFSEIIVYIPTYICN